MIIRWLADLVLAFHLVFVVFVVFGGLLALRWPRLAWIHLPAVAWGVALECAGWICPLTPLENRLRALAGETGYGGGFVEHYLLPLLYPPGLAPPTQWLLGSLVLGINIVIYTLLLRRLKTVNKKGSRGSLRI